jgi:hypothetical protein
VLQRAVRGACAAACDAGGRVSQQHPVEQLEVRGRLPDGFRFNGGLVELESSEYFRKLDY